MLETVLEVRYDGVWMAVSKTVDVVWEAMFCVVVVEKMVERK